MDRSLVGFKSRLFGHDKTTRNDVLEDISISLTTSLRCEGRAGEEGGGADPAPMVNVLWA